MNAQVSWINEALSAIVLDSILTASREVELTDRRRVERHPFFAPVLLIPSDRNEAMPSAYSREISTGRIGLLHVMPSPPRVAYEVCTEECDLDVCNLPKSYGVARQATAGI